MSELHDTTGTNDNTTTPSSFSRTADFILQQSPKTYQNYKSKSPEETLQWIQDVLQPWFPPYISAGLQPNEFYTTWFCRVTFLHPHIGQNGKGVTIPLALASGFAEFMERFQALYLLRDFSSNLPRLLWYPDSLPADSAPHWKEFNTALRREMNDRISQSALTELVENSFYQFHDLRSGSPVYLDRSFAYTPFLTTGTAAGNTREEALVQALCELFERYAARTIIENRTVVPSVPWEVLSEQTQSMLSEIQNSGFEVHVKDFSLGKGLPVVCVVVGTSEMGYHARPGCATDIDVAVERCILEFYQGVSITVTKIESVTHITEQQKEFYSILSDYLDSHFTLDEFFITKFPAAYDFPPHELEFLTQDSPEPFTPWEYSRKDFCEEMQLLLNLCENHQIRVCARDIGWMGFPAVQVFSPDLKAHEFDNLERQVLTSEPLKQFQLLLLQGVNSIRTRTFYELLCTPEVLYFCMQLREPRIDCLRGLVQEGPITQVNFWYFLGHVAYYFKDTALAACFFRCYNTFNPQEEYFSCLLRFMELLPENPWNEQATLREDVLRAVRHELCRSFSPMTVEQVLSDLKNPEDVLDDVDDILIPCVKCEPCPAAQECPYRELFPILKQLQNNFPDVLTWEENPQIRPCR
ncbi:MAG: hypothetical protein AYK18_12970 [Theionarchaea archaeon DG-70]|nr:MAG: hypothetical protein AYK18_12970 [Theionarchaea archaeon DG-70]